MKRTVRLFVLGLLFSIALFTDSKLFGRDEVYFYLHMPQEWAASGEISASLSGNSPEDVRLALYKVDVRDILAENEKLKDKPRDDSEDSGAPYISSDSPLPPSNLDRAVKVREWTIKVKKEKDQNWYHQDLPIENPGSGTYFLYATAAGKKTAVFFNVTDIAAISKSTGSDLLVYAVDKKTGAPLKDAQVSILRENGETAASRNTGSDGIAQLSAKSNSDDRPLIVEHRGHVALLNFYSYISENTVTYIYTDRPIYRPGQKAHIKGIFRAENGYKYDLPAASTAAVQLRDPKGNVVLDEEIPITDFGSFALDYDIADDAPLGYFYISATIDGKHGSAGFPVEEYRKPDYLITLTPEKSWIISGGSASLTLDAKYFFGEPLKDADVKYSVYTDSINDYHPFNKTDRRYIHDSYYPGHRSRTPLLEGTGKTGSDGRMTITIDKTAVTADTHFTVEARVADKGLREASASTTFTVYFAAFDISVDSDLYFVSPGKPVTTTFKTTSHDNLPVSSPLTARIIRHTWSKKTGSETTEVHTANLETSPSGEATLEYSPADPGYYTVEASATDNNGRAVSGRDYFYVASASSRFAYSFGSTILIVADHNEYEPGDTAHIMIATTLKNAYALVTAESLEILEREVIPLENGATAFDLIIDKRFSPNIDLVVTIISDNQLHEERIPISVPRKDKMLTLEITPGKPVYKPGETATLKISTLDDDGDPVPAELSLGIVDEALYSVAPESTQPITQAFYGTRYNRVNTRNSFYFHFPWIYGKNGAAMLDSLAAPAPSSQTAARGDMKMAMKEEAAGIATGEGNGIGNEVQPVIRSEFPDTAYWRADVTTGPSGEEEISFTVPDTLTTWRVTARGVTTDTKVGQTVATFLVKQNIIVRMQAPRFYTEDDEVTLNAVVHNYLDSPKKVRALINVKGLRLLEKNEKTITIPAGGDKSVEWRAVVEDPQEAWLTVKALTDEESDAMQVRVPVLPHGVEESVSAVGEVSRDTTFSLKLPDGSKDKTVPGTEKARVTISPSLAGGVFDSLEYLAGYPYGCVEQTMSRFLPDIAVAEAFTAAGKAPAGKLTELPDMIRAGIKRLADYQHADGGWGWWKDDDTDPFMTAYVVMGLTRARSADYSVPDGMISRGTSALKTMLAHDNMGARGYDAVTIADNRAYMVYALAIAGEKSPEAEKLLAGKSKLSIYGKSALAIALAKQGNTKGAAILAADIEKAATITAQTASWRGRTARYSWTDNEIENTAFALTALMAAAPKSTLIPKAVRYLNTNKRGDRWYSTKDTALAVMAIIEYATAYETAAPDIKYDIYINGKKTASGSFSKDDMFSKGASFDIPSADLRKGANKIRVVSSGKGRLYYQATATYFKIPLRGGLTGHDNGFRVRRYYSWDREGNKRLSPGTILKSGDVIWSHFSVKPAGRYEYVMLENYLPSGFEIDKLNLENRPKWCTLKSGGWCWYNNMEIRDEKVLMFFSYMHDDTYTFSVPIRAEVPGAVTAMPCRASMMYFPEISGASDEAKFKVVRPPAE